MNKINSVIKEVLTLAKPSKEELKEIGKTLEEFLGKLEETRKRNKINAEVFVGGSFAKNTIIKKDSYDIDIFIRFDKKYKDEFLSELTEKILPRTGVERIHGSRDYFKIKARENLFFEIIPVKMVKNPKEAENITDLSYSHVKYIKKKIKSGKTLDEIRIAKAFCYANQSYGAESYVRGFSGYGIELLVYHYGSFLKFVKAISKMKLGEKTVVDIEKQHKGKERILMDLNEAKLQSPIILIDPTYKQRNVLAALSEETLKNFQRSCTNFLKNPSLKFFQQEKINIEKVKEEAKKRGYEFVLLKIATEKQKGDIAGSKLLKFYKHLNEELSKGFEVKARGFEYGKEKTARSFFVGKNKGSLILQGPEVKDSENVKRFKEKHKKILIKNGKLYAKEDSKTTLSQFLKNWAIKNKKKIKDMDITKIFIEN